MYWFRRPPYLRWTAAVLVVAGALWMDFRGEPTELRPFALAGIEAGASVDETMLEYREVPIDLLPDVDPIGFAVVAIAAGEPLTPAALTEHGPLPEGWWAVEMEVPTGTTPGTELRLVVDDTGGIAIPAIVTAVVPTDQRSSWERDTAMVAIPQDRAAEIAEALSGTGVTVLVVEW